MNKSNSLFHVNLKGFIQSNPVLKNFIFKTYYKFFPQNTLAYWINKLDRNRPITVVQIGSNDGVSGDPIFKIALKNKNWNVLLVEPIPYLFTELKNNYPKESRFRFENVAINDGSLQKFYFLREGVLEERSIKSNWYKKIGSFDREHLAKHFNINIEESIEEIKIKGLTLEQLFIRNSIKSLDFLHIDAEGYDWKILSQLDVSKFKPHLILFEYKHLAEKDIQDALEYLHNYQIFKFSGDYLCILDSKLNKRDKRNLRNRAVH